MKKILTTLLSLASLTMVQAQESPKEEDFYKIQKVTSPEGTLLEVGGLTVLPDGNLGVATRRGDIWIVENPTSRKPFFRKYATGLHEILGLTSKDGALYCAQRGELTKIVDANHDGKADTFETIYAWPLSGHYHEYSYGPKIAPDGQFFVTGNVAFGDEEWWRGESRVPWRGWTMKISENGTMQPWATGMRSPCGMGIYDGELFYADNQGDWMGSGGIVHVKKGAFVGHPAGLQWTGMANSPLKLTPEQFYAKIDERRRRDENGRAIKPENVINETPTLLYTMKDQFPNVDIQTPAVWLPHGILGISNSEIVEIPQGAFGPFAGQLLIGDQGMSKISRVFMEKVNGEYQGGAIELRNGFRSGVLRMAFAKDGSLFVGETNRGWGSAGDANEGLQRLVWNGAVPFEIRTVKAMPDGFEVEFTKPVDKKSAEDLASYRVESFLYKYHSVYGSPTINKEALPLKGVKVSADGLKARLIVNDLRKYYIHQLTLDGVRGAEGSYSLVHPIAYYTLNNIPDGQKLAMSEVSTTNSAAAAPTPASAPAAVATGKKAPAKATTTGARPKLVEGQAVTMAKAPTYEEVKGLLTRHTCAACHQANKRQVGPAFSDVAKRKYTNDQIVELIYNPKPHNWPDYSTEMPPMPQVPKPDALKIAAWINSLAPASGSNSTGAPKP
ncbi:c-type cytochrome [Spirosoma endophyticum]|uniref:Cytochrome c551/c552 n=1 Tax=Spirosoma endophyticum TaxID=662367 RepID=A0A1I1VGD0_9BACT|nr:c-type cytochrome [Spirosoma endophyticum]SFD81996.1 Cytochrome c551/c552 [Spirosoma endophyticum]